MMKKYKQKLTPDEEELYVCVGEWVCVYGGESCVSVTVCDNNNCRKSHKF